jgi:hypothetical protein
LASQTDRRDLPILWERSESGDYYPSLAAAQDDYIKRWVPELKDVNPSRFTSLPTERLAPDYPISMVDHAKEREIAVERFRAASSFKRAIDPTRS